MDEQRSLGCEVGAQLVARNDLRVGGRTLENFYAVECYGPDGALKWRDDFRNLVVTAGLNDSLNRHLKGSSYTAAWYVGIISGTAATIAAGDTMSSHSGWTEGTIYTGGTRPSLSLGVVSAGSVDNSGTKAAFTINAAGTLCGAFVTTGTAVGGTVGTLYGAGTFASNRVVANADTLNVTIVFTATAS